MRFQGKLTGLSGLAATEVFHLVSNTKTHAVVVKLVDTLS